MRNSLYLRQRGFSVVETILVVTLVVALAAVVVPSVSEEIDHGSQDRALDDCASISRALLDYRRDTGLSPCGFNGFPSYGWLRSGGVQPRFESLPEGSAGNLAWFLMSRLMGGGRRWSGPYLDHLASDPWGRQYVVYVHGFHPEDAPSRSAPDGRPRYVWVLSAGPDGIVQTKPTDLTPVGDDVGLVID